MARLTIPDAVPLDVRFEIATTIHGAIADVREPGLWLMLDALALMIFDPDDPQLAADLNDALLLLCARQHRALDPRAFAALFAAQTPTSGCWLWRALERHVYLAAVTARTEWLDLLDEIVRLESAVEL